jgi:hypothetical protein
MRVTKARPQLDALARQLREWEAALPPRARRFHVIRAELERGIHEAIPYWWSLWIQDEVVERYRERVDRLGRIVESLAQLIATSESLGAEVRRLGESATSFDQELTAWLKNRCRDWFALLGQLGAKCERDADVAADQALYERAETAVRTHHEALLHLAEAERVRATLGQDVRAAMLAGMLPQLRKRLFTEGASFAWIGEIQELTQPLRIVAERIQDPPRELNEVGAMLTELRGWSPLLSNDDAIGRGIEELEQRRFRIADWEQQEVDDLVDEARRLRTHVLDRVEQMRANKQRDLEQGLRDLRQACGDQPDLEARLAELASRQSNRPQLFRDWLAHFDKFRHSFKAVAQQHIRTLESRLLELRQSIADKLADLERRPLSDEVRKDAILAAGDLAYVREATDVEEILTQLRRVNEIAQHVESLEERAQHDLAELEQQEKALATQYEALVSELSRVRGVTLDLAAIDEQMAILRDNDKERELETHRRHASRLASALTAAEADFVEQCRTRFAEHFNVVQHAFEVLDRAGAHPPATQPPAIGEESTPHQAADAVLEARRMQNVLLRLARATRDRFDARLASATAELRAIRPDDLGPADRQRTVELLHALDALAASRDRDLIHVLETMTEVLGDCDRFFEMLQQEQHSAHDRLAELHLQFREFTDDQLSQYCHELSERVGGLLYGVPEHPRQWSAVHQQLDRAAALFKRVRHQAKRIAADELHRAAETLRTRLRGGADMSFRDHARKLLAELDALGNDRLPPAALRQRVIHAAQRRM